MLFDKIYKAINEAVLHALSTNIEDQDIDFEHTGIDNGINVLNGLVPELSDSLRDPVYEEIKKFSKENHLFYIPTGLSEIFEIYKKIARYRSYSDIDIKWIDCNGIIMVVLDDNTEIPYNLFDKDTHNAVFLKIRDDNGKQIILYKDLLQITAKIGIRQKKDNVETFGPVNDYLFNPVKCKKTDNEAQLDFNGYINTYDKLNMLIKKRVLKDYPIFKYICKLTKKYQSTGWEAYIPAYGELQIVSDYLVLINNMLFNIRDKKTEYLERNTNYFKKEDSLANFNWTSSEKDEHEVWTLECGRPLSVKKNRTGCGLLPMFKKI